MGSDCSRQCQMWCWTVSVTTETLWHQKRHCLPAVRQLWTAHLCRCCAGHSVRWRLHDVKKRTDSRWSYVLHGRHSDNPKVVFKPAVRCVWDKRRCGLRKPRSLSPIKLTQVACSDVTAVWSDCERHQCWSSSVRGEIFFLFKSWLGSIERQENFFTCSVLTFCARNWDNAPFRVFCPRGAISIVHCSTCSWLPVWSGRAEFAFRITLCEEN